MTGDLPQYETVIGLEVHAQLLTDSKLFCGDRNSYGGEPNTHVSPITLAHPGTLPRMNRKAIELAVRIGLACGCGITRENYVARKNYFYPDLPKGYQLSQHTTPICRGGIVSIQSGGKQRNIHLNRIHLEEDAGKSMHDAVDNGSGVDFNRAGVPLIEIVTEPDLQTSDEAYAFLTELRKLVRYLDVCDGNMEQGSLRCDANVSVRRVGELKLGTKVEVKNLNSIRNVKRAIDAESARMIGLLNAGEWVIQETRSFDADSGYTFSTREKEDADDYRYFPDPDLTRFLVDDAFLNAVRSTIPTLQAERVAKYTSVFQLSQYDAQQLTDEKEFADYFEATIVSFGEVAEKLPALAKSAANWMLGPVRSWLNENNAAVGDFPVSAVQSGNMVRLVEEGKISFSTAATKLLPEMIRQPASDSIKVATDKGWLQNKDDQSIEKLIDDVLARFPEKVAEFKKGKKGLIGLFVGEVMKLSNGAADPKLTNAILSKKLKS
ncbi:MAG TPA: Asp-tRNA(Asn)/Glu-tRNA(Gln) amidotransferase subunit GatB [Chitinophagaceae bacterium]